MSTLSNINENGLKSITSSHSVSLTADRLVKILTEKDMNLVARIDHAAGAEKIGEKLRPTQLILFANPKAGTPLIQNSQSVAIDLPQKILIWEDENGKVWLTYNDPNYLVNRHRISGCDELIKKIANSLNSIIKDAAE